MSQDLQHLVDVYVADPSDANREAVVMASVPLVRSLIGRLTIPNHPLASHEDLENSGLIGLLQALDSYDPEMGTRFVTHAYRRVQGALIDYLRSIDVLSRGKRRKVAEAHEAMETLRQMLGEEPTDQDVADYMGISLTKYHALLSDAQRRFALSLHHTFGPNEEGQTMLDVLPSEEAEQGFQDIETKAMLASLEQLITTLPERQQTILGLYYMEDLTLREVGQVLNLTEARISQILGKLLLTLRARLTEVRPAA